MSPHRHVRLWVCMCALATALAHAQTAPDAGALQRETERDLRGRLPPPPAAPAAPMQPAAKGATVTVSAFVIEGATLIPADELAALLADLVGRAMTLAELEQAAQRLAAHYRTRGWLARVYLPAQEIRGGRVRIVVVEGRLSGVKLESGAARADAAYVERIVGAGLAPGQPVATAALERALLVANDLPGVQATGVLEPGEAIGDVRLRLKVEDGPYVAGDAALTNHGTRATGLAQAAASLVVNPGGGDQWSVRALASTDLATLRAGYALPLGTDGLRLQVHASTLRYTLGGDYAALDASGNARTLGAALSWPWRRGSTENLSLGAGLEARRYADDAMGAALRRKRADAATFSVGGDRVDNFGGGGFSQYGVVLTAARLDLADAPADYATDQAGPRSHGRYAKLNASVARLQRLPADFALYASLAAQWTDRNLDSSEKFALGGPNGVRAYPVNEAAGDEGWLLSLELRKEIADGWSAFALIDGGRVTLHRDEWPGWQGGGVTPNRYGLAGAGFGLNWSKPGDLALQLVLAAPLGGNPGATVADRNQDGSTRGTRGWLRLTKLF